MLALHERGRGRLMIEDQDRSSTVVVVDDHRSFAEMLAAALDDVAGLRCVGTAFNAADGVALAARLRPDMVVMDIQMPKQDGLAATAQIKKIVPATLVAVVTAHTSPEWVGRAAQAGASAFMPKNGSLEEMIGVLTNMRAGQMVVAPSTYLTPPALPSVEPSALSRRELEVLRLLAAGIPVKDLASAVGITVGTCRSYVKSLRQKLGATSQLDAVLKARELGLLND
jgi:DNA-binding NarL/FixJ family response regulator